MPWDPYDRNCPSRRLLDRIGDRWTVLIVGILAEEGPIRFGELARRVDGISQKMLTQVLRGLKRDGLVRRTVYATVPPKVEYSLTSLGLSLVEILEPFHSWLSANMDQVLAARAAFDERGASLSAEEQQL